MSEQEKSDYELYIEVVNDCSLSFKAKGVFCYLLSLPKDLSIHHSLAVKRSFDGISSIKSSFIELVKHGYLVMEKIRNEKGQMVDTRYVIQKGEKITQEVNRIARQKKQPKKKLNPNGWTKEKYQLYLKSTHWLNFRSQARKFFKYTCQICGSKRKLSVHHLSYVNIGHESLLDVTLVCDPCHKKLHGIKVK
jgi:hypothetical protein